VDFVFIGKIIRAYGLKGKVIVHAYSNDTHNIKPGRKVWIDPDGDSLCLTVHSVSPFKGVYRVGFIEISGRQQAEALLQKYLAVPRGVLEKLPDDAFYVFDLLGCSVKTLSGEQRGTIEDVISNPGNDLLKVSSCGKIAYIPMVKSIVREINIEKSVVFIEPVEGLFELS